MMENKSVLERIKHTSVYELKALSDEKLQEILQQLRIEMREVHRAVNWVEGIIRLKDIEREQKNAEVKS